MTVKLNGNQSLFQSLGRYAPSLVTNAKLVDSGYPHGSHADKNPYPHDNGADKDSYPHDNNNQCIILKLQLSFVMINVQVMLVLLISFYSLIFARFCNKYVLILLFLFVYITHVMSHTEIKSHRIRPIWKPIPIRLSNLTEFSDHLTTYLMKK